MPRDMQKLTEDLWTLDVEIEACHARADGRPPPELRRRRGASAAAIAALEKRLARPLPPSLRTFLETSNGMTLHHEYLKVLGSSSAIGGKELRKHMEGWCTRMRAPLPRGTVIGWDPYANSLLLLDTHAKPRARGSARRRHAEAPPSRRGEVHDAAAERLEQ